MPADDQVEMWHLLMESFSLGTAHHLSDTEVVSRLSIRVEGRMGCTAPNDPSTFDVHEDEEPIVFHITLNGPARAFAQHLLSYMEQHPEVI